MLYLFSRKKLSKLILLISRMSLFFFIIGSTVRCTNGDQNELSDLQFEEFDRATHIQISQYNISPARAITIYEPEKIDFARQFIKEYPNGWKLWQNSGIIGAQVEVSFYREQEYLGGYGISPDYLTYSLKYVRQYKPDEKQMILFERLGVMPH